jgi:hypothetical protein
MSPERVHAYRRVVQILSELGPSKLLAEEQDRIRHAADNLFFSCDLAEDPAASESVQDIERLCDALVVSGRWEQITATRLSDSVIRCGPSPAAELKAA